ncbi:hypothetical protein Tco_0359899 [Tanacetum coccineum]
MQEIKRLDELKAEKDKSKKKLKKWVAAQAGKLGIPPPPKLIAFELPLAEKKTCMKRKKRIELIHEVLVKENIVVDGMQRNLTLPEGVVGKVGMVIREPKDGIFLYNGKFDLVYNDLIYKIESRPDFVQVRKIVEKNLDGNMRKISAAVTVAPKGNGPDHLSYNPEFSRLQSQNGGVGTEISFVEGRCTILCSALLLWKRKWSSIVGCQWRADGKKLFASGNKLLLDIGTICQAFYDGQTQNQQLLQQSTDRDNYNSKDHSMSRLEQRLGLKANVSVIRLQAKMEAWKHTGLERPDTTVLNS